MKKSILIFLVFIISLSFGYSKPTLKITLNNPNENCNMELKLFFFDLNNDNIFDAIYYDGCNPQALAYFLVINSSANINQKETATLIQGSFEEKNFVILIYDPAIQKYTHKLYYDEQISKAVLEDYSDNNGNQTPAYDEADNYFLTQQFGSIFIITKISNIDVQSVMLCSIDGRIIKNLQNVEGWGQFVFDMSGQPSGMYLLRFTAPDKALTKKLVWIK